MEEYIDEFGDFDTFNVRTPSGGIHYYFLYETKNKATNILINQIPNATEFYGYGIDVRTEKKTGGVGGYVVGFGSKIDGNEYTIINNKHVIEMPEDLAFWLLQGCPGNYNNEIDDKDENLDKKDLIKKIKKNITKKVIFNPKYKYDTTIEYVKKILDELPVEWTENRYNWLKVLTCLKNLNIKGNEELFYKFSKKSTLIKHEGILVEQKNKDEWNKNNCLIDFNYIICTINKLKKTSYPLIQKYKPVFNNIIFDNNYVFNNKNVEYDYNFFEKYDNIIIQATCGTGKTYDTSKKFLEYCQKNNNNKQIISIVSLTATANQHITSFSKDNIKLKDYRNCSYNELNGNLVICINSLLKLNYMNVEQIKDKIIYIDEFECFSNNLTHNKNLDNNIRLINNLLMKLVKNCHKLIISDALINENVKHFLNISKSTRKTIFIKNTYKKFNGVKAVRYHDENDFLNQVKNDIKNDKYFLFGSDSCSKITQYFDETSKKDKDEKEKINEKDDELITEIFNKLIENVDDEKKKKFILITSKTAYIITDANKQFKDNFVFFSPSIVNSVDFSSISSQNAYLYFNSLTINSQSMFQQACRTRNINTLKFFANQRQNNYIYEDINDVEILNKDLINSCDKIKKVCLNTNEDDEETIIENTFFKMWCFNEYTNDCYNTNKICHFQNILIEEGFILVHIGKDIVLDKKKQTQMIKTTKENSVNDYQEFVKLYKLGENDKFKSYEKYIQRINILNLKHDELDIDKFGYLVYNEHNLNSYFNLLKLFKTDEFINEKIDDLNVKSYSIKIINNVHNKIYLLRKFEKLFNIEPFNFDFKLDENNISKLTDSEFIKYKKIFRSEKKKPVKLNDFKIFYKQMIENISGNNLNIIIQKRIIVDGEKNRKYKIDEKKIQFFYLLSMRNCDKINENYNYDLLKIFSIDKPNDYKKYYFCKN